VKHNLLIKIFALLIFSSFFTQQAFGQQTGKIAGIVSDKNGGETLVGLSVKIESLNKATSTDVRGYYVFSSLPVGKYKVDFTYLGYSAKSISDVEITAGNVTNLDIIMEASSNQLSEVVITVSQKQENINTVYEQQKNSARISDGISAEIIRKSPDKNTGEVLKRISGTTIQDNKFVVVRGLSDRYNTAQLDNSPLPSTEPNRKAFSFDIVPSSLVDNVIINKTATPDLPGDFAGGSIQIVTKDIPVQNFTSFALGYGYNTQTTFKNFQSGYRNLTDYFGFDNGSRGLAFNFPSTNSVINGLTPGKNIASINSLNSDWKIQSNNALPNQNYQFSIGKVMDLKKSNSRIGTIASLTYRNSQQINPSITRKYHVYDYTDEQYKFSTSLGALLNLAYTYGKSKVTLKNIYNRIFDDQFTYRTGSNLASGSDNQFYAFDLTQKSLLKTTLDGEHKLGEKNSKLKWTLGYSNVVNDQPDQRKINYSRNISDRNNPSVGFTANVTSVGKENTRLFFKLHEDVYSGDVSYSTPVKLFNNSGTFKFGAGSQYRSRASDVRFLGLQLNSNASDANEIRERPISTIFGEDVILANKYKLDELANAADRYTAWAFANSGYAMLDNKLSEKIRLIWGVRAELYNLYLSTFSSNQKDIENNNLDILPSANLTYSVTNKSNLRFSYYRTLARPEFRELAPFEYYDYELLAIQEGNPALKRTLIDNADIRYELYPSAGQIFSVSLFYKKFDNAIESSIIDYNSTPIVSYFNSKQANVYGAELEFRKSLIFINNKPFFNNTTIYTNLSLIKSKVENLGNNPLLLEKERPLIGQSPYVVNAGLQHSALGNKVSFNLSYNRIGRRIYKAGGQTFPSVWEAPRDVVDFQASFKLIKQKGELKLNTSDLLNQSNVLYFDYDKNKMYSTGDQTIGKYKPGSNFSLSFSYSL